MNNYRTFQPVILFHDHSYSTDASGVTHHIHIPYGDPYYSPLIQQKKQTVGTMLKSNGEAWFQIIQTTRQELSPKPTLSHLISDNDHHQSTSSSSSSSSESGSESDHEDQPSTSPVPSNTLMLRKRRGNLPKTVTAVLKQWLIEHCRNPYPTEAEKTGLKEKTGLTLNQISNWFINARRRLLPQILDTNNKEEEEVVHKRKRRSLDYLYEEGKIQSRMNHNSN
ncbi:homeobox KN domain-containing protein [Choanephora cucurbitarum]|nr:homeobox KN domain-containing protein [Choanephora cucurbitarum]